MTLLDNFVSIVVQCKDIRWILKDIDYYFINSIIPCPFKESHLDKATLTSRDNYYYIKQLKEEWDILCGDKTTTDNKLIFSIGHLSHSDYKSFDIFRAWPSATNKLIQLAWSKNSVYIFRDHGKITRRSSVIAARIGIVELFELIVKKGEYNIRDQPLNNTDELNAAIEEGNINIVKYILEHECQDEKIIFTDKQFFAARKQGHTELLNFMKKHNGIPDICPDPSQFKYETTIYARVERQEPIEKPDASKIKEAMARFKEKYGDGIQFDFPGLDNGEHLDKYETLLNEVSLIEEAINKE